MSEAREPQHVVVLGGGIGGLSTAASLRRLLREEDTITVVDWDGSHVQGLSLLWVLRGWRDPGDVTVTPTPAALKGVTLLRADAQEIVIEDRRVVTSEGELHYDALVIALGAQLNPAAVPGLPEAVAAGQVGEFYTLAGAAAAHEALRSVRSGRVAVVVSSMPYKCPAAPWEAAFLTADLLAECGTRGDVEVQVYTPEPQPMPVAGPVVGAALVEMLGAEKIEVQFATQVASVDGDARRLTFANGDSAEFDYALFVLPHQAPDVVRSARFSEPGWIPVDAHTLATAADGVWAIGDNASITLTNGKPLPKAAVFARGQAEAVASGVARYLGCEVPEVRFAGLGACYVEVGGGLAAKGAGDFYAEGGPVVELTPPSREMHEEKERDEATWAALWTA